MRQYSIFNYLHFALSLLSGKIILIVSYMMWTTGRKGRRLTFEYSFSQRICSSRAEKQVNIPIPPPKHNARMRYGLFLRS